MLSMMGSKPQPQISNKNPYPHNSIEMIKINALIRVLSILMKHNIKILILKISKNQVLHLKPNQRSP